jgi:hypothetical protein
MIPNERPTPLTDAAWADKEQNILVHAKTLERSLAERTEERDEARAICALSKGMAVHAITCIHHTDAERAALPAHGNCPVCAKRLLDTALAKLAKCRTTLEWVAESRSGHASTLARQTLEETK